MIALREANFKGLVTAIVLCSAQLPHLTSGGPRKIPDFA
jgi:hypothetical protein